jgi:hypothetical protein
MLPGLRSPLADQLSTWRADRERAETAEGRAADLAVALDREVEQRARKVEQIQLVVSRLEGEGQQVEDLFAQADRIAARSSIDGGLRRHVAQGHAQRWVRKVEESLRDVDPVLAERWLSHLGPRTDIDAPGDLEEVLQVLRSFDDRLG